MNHELLILKSLNVATHLFVPNRWTKIKIKVLIFFASENAKGDIGILEWVKYPPTIEKILNTGENPSDGANSNREVYVP